MERRSLSEIWEEAQNLFPFSQSIRRDLHRHPELGYQEKRTAGIIAGELKQLGYEVRTGIAETGVAALIEGNLPGRVVMARVDLDALPIQEETGAEYASKVPGVMHACGHDGHVAVGLTVARMLASRREELHGTVKLVFQPAEEGLGGAERMIAEGVLDDPVPEAALALHLWNQLPMGKAVIRPGPLMAAADMFTIRIQGHGGHGAMPEKTADPVLAGAQVVTALQSVVSRSISPLESAVVSVTQFSAGDAFNVIPDAALLRGTIRTYEPDVRERVLERVRSVAEHVAAGMGCSAEVLIQPVTPAVINDPQVAKVTAAAAAAAVPDLRIDETYRVAISEDMAYMLEQVPGCYFMVGAAPSAEGTPYGHHHPKFEIDERSITVAAAILTAAILDLAKSSDHS